MMIRDLLPFCSWKGPFSFTLLSSISLQWQGTSIKTNIFFLTASRPCAKSPRKEDPLDIFVFDLTSSPEDEICEIQKSKPVSLKTASQSVANTHRTRSKTIKSLKNAVGDKTTVSIADSNDVKNQKRSKSKINSYLPSVKKRTSSLHGKTSPASKHNKEGKDNTDGYSLVPTTPNRPVIATIEKGIPRSKIAKSVFQVTIWLYF